MKKKKRKDELLKDKEENAYNQGRLAGDRKWIEGIDRRIEELEEQVGIPELRRLKKKTSYKWR